MERNLADDHDLEEFDDIEEKGNWQAIKARQVAVDFIEGDKDTFLHQTLSRTM
jgi:hypothetical protein